jgi:hypothetical protein
MCVLHMAVRHAIAVQNIGRMQVGHIPRDMASKLAPLIDSNLITLEGTMNEGNCELTALDFVPVVIRLSSAHVQLLTAHVSGK